MIHTGIDLTSVARIKKSLEAHSENFLNRICTPPETVRLQQEKRKDEKVAGLFALKEAFSKALGTGIGSGVSFHDIEVSYTELGQPRIKYTGTKFKSASSWQVSCSLSHEGDIVAAIVVIAGDLS